MITWLTNLTPESIILIVMVVVIFIMNVVTQMSLKKVSHRVGEQEFYILDSIVNIDGKDYMSITVINKAFSTNQINVIGIELKQVSYPLESKLNIVAPRSKYQVHFLLDDVKKIVCENTRKYRKFKVFAENEIGLHKTVKPRLNNRYLKKQFKQLKKTERKDRKQTRFENGTYNLLERVGLITGLLFRPFYKLLSHMALSTNKTLRESEIRRQQKKQHDKLKYKLDQEAFELNRMRIKEESIKENRTREVELEYLKKQKELEIEKLKEKMLNEQFLAEKAKIASIEVEKVAKETVQKETISKEQPKKTTKKVNTEPVLEDDKSKTVEATIEVKKPSRKKASQVESTSEMVQPTAE